MICSETCAPKLQSFNGVDQLSVTLKSKRLFLRNVLLRMHMLCLAVVSSFFVVLAAYIN